jgi:multicomponent Na+:H+ antiporter subunit D
MMAVLLISSLLNVAYLLPVAARGFFVAGPADGKGEHESEGIREAPLACVIPLCLTAFGCVLLFFYANALYDLLAPIAGH